MQMHDFRSDIVTLPTPAMMKAVNDAPLGDAGRGDDPTVNALEQLACDITGKPAALFLPSCTMANLVAVIAHDCCGGEVVVEHDAHIYNAEGGGLSVVASAVARPLKAPAGVLSPLDVTAALKGPGDPARLVCLENTHNGAGGTVTPIETMAALKKMAADAGVPIHLDGARLFNAAAYLDVPLERLCRHVDRRDHARARRLACGIADLDRRLVDLQSVQTNIVNCFVDDAGQIVRALREHGVLALGGGRKMRFVTHSQVGDESVDAALEALAAILKRDRRK